MKSARVAAVLWVAVVAAGCQPTDEQRLEGGLARGLPERFANCIAERTFDALTPEQEWALKAATHDRYLRSPADFGGPAPRTLAAAQVAIARDLPNDLAGRVRAATGRCRVHNWRLG